MRKYKIIISVLLSLLLGLPLLVSAVLIVVAVCLYNTADFLQPEINVELARYRLIVDTDSFKVCNKSSLRLNRHGLWEAHIVGNPVDRGVSYGVMSKDLLKYQEDVFVEQIHEIVPSEWWVETLHKLIIIFNRNMAKHIPEEYRKEIYGVSLSCTDEYNMYGSPYVRQLNYHAAHDIGHAMQEYMLVGCSSFACWADESEGNGLVVGRNFDFYVGDKFAENKVVLFVEPDKGYNFASISWPGMMGVLSGMNEKGLTVTINAAKGTMPVSSAMPISLLARHILQYASNIEEAYGIAREFETFVSESLLIGSVADGQAAVIEKTPEKIALFHTQNKRIVCTNHYQSNEFSTDEYNMENISSSDSPYRHDRLNELINGYSPLDVSDAVKILRDRNGKGCVDIGIGNEKSINQFIAHHSVVFEPEELRFWVSSSPWQLGEYVCYDLDDVFGGKEHSKGSYAAEVLNVAADSAKLNDEYYRVSTYRRQYKLLKTAIDKDWNLSQEFVNNYIANNPNYYQVYNSLGDYELSRLNYKEAVEYWRKALLHEVPRTGEIREIEQKIEKYD